MTYEIRFNVHGHVTCEAESREKAKELFVSGALDEEIFKRIASSEVELVTISKEE